MQTVENKLLNLRLQAERRTVPPDHDLMLWAHDEIERLRSLVAKISQFRITDSDGYEVCEDSLHEIRKIAKSA